MGGDAAGHVGSDNESNDEAVDYSGNVIRTPAQSVTEDSFSPTQSDRDPKKSKISPSSTSKAKAGTSGNNSNSKSSSPSKVVKRATPMKGKSINVKK